MRIVKIRPPVGSITRHKLVYFGRLKKLDNKKQLEIHNRVKQLYARKLHKGVAEVTRESKIKLSNHRGNPTGVESRKGKTISSIWRSADFEKAKKTESKKTFETNMKKNIE